MATITRPDQIVYNEIYAGDTVQFLTKFNDFQQQMTAFGPQLGQTVDEIEAALEETLQQSAQIRTDTQAIYDTQVLPARNQTEELRDETQVLRDETQGISETGLPAKTGNAKQLLRVADDETSYVLSPLLTMLENIGAAVLRNTLGLGTAATQSDGRYVHRGNNLSDLIDKAAARLNLGLKSASLLEADQMMRRDQSAITDSGTVKIRNGSSRHVWFEDENGEEQALVYHSAVDGALRIRLRNGTDQTQAEIKLTPNGEVSIETGRMLGNGSGLSNVNADTVDGKHASAFSPAGHNHDYLYPRRDAISDVGFASNNPALPYFRRLSDGVVYYLQRNLGFTPVQQGGGQYMSDNKVRLGWDGPAGHIRAQVDGTLLGAMWTDSCALRRYVSVAGAGVVGVPAFLRCIAGSTSPGQHRAGSDLRWAAAYGDNGQAPAGTWECWGQTAGDGPDQQATLWLRIA
ncbi:hypothetical protein [Chromohalobacter israelensis]|uniref:hypothetical protein n=1 Tax=Chromohalobacter israelensis TaxID=141390 RepID=UPI00265B7F75|nr:hypothetical protein [Chromohalobacter salexigens]MDO0944664.1 hypothetical protein [Chromohalobacter salexigens]